jgi:hypothetical protein
LSFVSSEKDLVICKSILESRFCKGVAAAVDENVRYLTDDFKNSIVVRSCEVLNDLNINPAKKLNKFEGFRQIEHASKLSKSVDGLNYIIV